VSASRLLVLNVYGLEELCTHRHFFRVNFRLVLIRILSAQILCFKFGRLDEIFVSWLNHDEGKTLIHQSVHS
jgi:hypothetical protein